MRTYDRSSPTKIYDRSNYFDWTEERVAKLKKLWKEDYSSREIAEQLGTSRNSVVGKVNRLQLPRKIESTKKRGSEKGKTSSKKKGRALTNSALSKKLVDTFIDIQNDIEDIEVTEETTNFPVARNTKFGCQWIFGDPRTKNFSFCGKEKLLDKSYCKEHYDIAYTSSKEK